MRSFARFVLGAVCLMLLPTIASAQTSAIAGTVKDEDGKPIKGASVRYGSSWSLIGLRWTLTDEMGKFRIIKIGPDEERWDLSFVAEYPSLAAFNDILRDPVYREAAAHRKAAAADSRLIRLAALPQGSRFGQFLQG